jgi:RHS repeat-associated protein
VTLTNYNAASQVTKVTFGSGDGDEFFYDNNTGRMTQYKFWDNGTNGYGNLTWNANGSLKTLAITDPFNSADAQTCNYTHDDLARIASANCGSAWSQTFTYDAFGNITKSGTISWMPGYNLTTNRYTLGGTSYDSNGNLLADTFHSYTWDSEGNPATIDSIGLTYDALDRVVEQNQSGTYYQIVYTPMGSKLGLFRGQTIQQLYVPLPGGTKAEYLSWGLSHYRHADWLGSDRFETGASDHSVTDSNAYAPFGEPYAPIGNGELSFTGQNKDTLWLQYDFPSRQYVPKQGRWISPDRAGLAAVNPVDPQSWNRYAYVRNGPLAAIDPTGMRMSVCPGGPTVCPLHLAGGEGAGWGCMEGFDCNYGFFNDEAALGGCDPAFGCLQNIDLTAICPVGANCGSLVQDALSRLWSGILGLPTVPCGGTSFSGPWCNSNPMVNPIMDADAANNGTQQPQQSRLNQAVKAAGHTLFWGQVIGTGVGCGVGALVAGGATAATETYPLAGETIPAGCVGGGMIGFVEALPYSTLGAIVDFGLTYWGH